MKLYILGHSIRRLAPDRDWTEKRRDEFLIKSDIHSPKSVDKNVWDEFVSDEVQTDAGPLPLPMWGDKEKMLKLSQYSINRADLVALTIGLFIDEDLPEFIDLNELSIVDVIEGVFLGYDVADEGLTSALSNCGYTDEEIIEARLKFSSEINSNGLLISWEAAKEFLKYSTERVPDHAPFFVFPLYADKQILP